METGKVLYFHYSILEEEMPARLTPADINYLFGIEPKCELIFTEDGLDFEIIAIDSEDDNYLRGVNVSIRRKLEDLKILYSVRSGYYG